MRSTPCLNGACIIVSFIFCFHLPDNFQFNVVDITVRLSLLMLPTLRSGFPCCYSWTLRVFFWNCLCILLELFLYSSGTRFSLSRIILANFFSDDCITVYCCCILNLVCRHCGLNLSYPTPGICKTLIFCHSIE